MKSIQNLMYELVYFGQLAIRKIPTACTTRRITSALIAGLPDQRGQKLTRPSRILCGLIVCFPLVSAAQGFFFPPTSSTLQISTCFETVTGLGTDCRVPSPGVPIPEGSAIVVDESPVGAFGSAELFLEWGWHYSPKLIRFTIEDGSGLFVDRPAIGGRAEFDPQIVLQGDYVVPPRVWALIGPITLVGNVADGGGAVSFNLTLGGLLGRCGSPTLTASYINNTPGPFSVTLPAQVTAQSCVPSDIGSTRNYTISLSAINTRVVTGTTGSSSINLSEPIVFGTTDGVPADIDVTPEQVNFGDVEVGANQPAMVTISNVGLVDLTVTDISLQSGADYAITSAPGLPLVLSAGGFEDITVTFTPLAAGARPTDFLEITSNDPIDGLVSVPLDGVGVVLDVSPSEQIANIIMVIEDGVDMGTIIPEGPGQSGPGRLGALINMMEVADDLIADELMAEACQQLLDAFKRTDGLSGRGNPPDFISGTDAALVASLIQDLMADLGCP